MAPESTKDCRATIPTAGETFRDGTAIELLRDTDNPAKLSLVLCREGILNIKTEMPYANRVYVPVPVEPSILKAVRFPSRVAPPETTRELFTDVQALLRRYLGQLDSPTTALVFVIFASWVSPVLQMAPLLWIYSPAGSPRNLTLQMLRLLVRRPLCLAGIKRGDLLRAPMGLHPTLLLDEPDMRPALQSILPATAHRGSHVLSGAGVRELYGPKIVVSSNPPQRTAHDEVLRVALIPVSGQLPSLDKEAEEELAEQFQARFVGYVLRNFSCVECPNFDVSGLSLPLQALARALGAAVIGDSELQAKILPLLKDLDEETRADRASAFDSIVIEAMLFFIHQDGWSKVRMDDIATQASAIYKGRGFRDEPSPEQVGWGIKRLGVPRRRINRAGNGIELTVSTCRLIHRLASSYGVRAMQGELRSGCRYCREIEAMSVEAAS